MIGVSPIELSLCTWFNFISWSMSEGELVHHLHGQQIGCKAS